jgi:hypothetical protein
MQPNSAANGRAATSSGGGLAPLITSPRHHRPLLEKGGNKRVNTFCWHWGMSKRAELMIPEAQPFMRSQTPRNLAGKHDRYTRIANGKSHSPTESQPQCLHGPADGG